MLNTTFHFFNYTSEERKASQAGGGGGDVWMGICCNGSCTNTNNTTNNMPINKAYPYIITNFIISVFIIFINLIVITVYTLKRKSLLKNPSSWLLISLSKCDLMKGVGVILILVFEMIPQYKYPSQTKHFRYRIFVDIYNTFVLENIVLHLCGLTLDRYLVMFRPYKYSSMVTKTSILWFLSFSWLFSFTHASLQCSWLHNIISGHLTIAFCVEFDSINKFDFWYSTTSFFVFLTLPVVLLGIAFTMMFFEVRYILSRTEHTRKTYYRQLRALYVFALMYVSFAILVLPYFSMRLFLDINYWTGKEEKLNSHVLGVTSTLRNLTSIINPLLYAGTDPKFKTVVLDIFGRLDDQHFTTPNLSENELRRFSKMSFEFNRAILQSRLLRTGKREDSPTMNSQNNSNMVDFDIPDTTNIAVTKDNKIENTSVQCEM